MRGQPMKAVRSVHHVLADLLNRSGLQAGIRKPAMMAVRSVEALREFKLCEAKVTFIKVGGLSTRSRPDRDSGGI